MSASTLLGAVRETWLLLKRKGIQMSHPSEGGGLALRREILRTSGDPRALRTQGKVLQAAQELSAYGGNEISVSKLVAAANISRATFYTYFADLEDFALHLHDTTLRDITAQEESKTHPPEPGTESEFFDARRQSMQQLVDHFATNRSLYASVLSVAQTRVIEQRIAKTIEESIIHLHQDWVTPPDGIHLQPMAHMLSAAFTRLLCDWVTDRIHLGTSAMTQHLLELMPPWMRGARPAD